MGDDTTDCTTQDDTNFTLFKDFSSYIDDGESPNDSTVNQFTLSNTLPNRITSIQKGIIYAVVNYDDSFFNDTYLSDKTCQINWSTSPDNGSMSTSGAHASKITTWTPNFSTGSVALTAQLHCNNSDVTNANATITVTLVDDLAVPTNTIVSNATIQEGTTHFLANNTDTIPIFDFSSLGAASNGPGNLDTHYRYCHNAITNPQVPNTPIINYAANTIEVIRTTPTGSASIVSKLIPLTTNADCSHYDSIPSANIVSDSTVIEIIQPEVVIDGFINGVANPNTLSEGGSIYSTQLQSYEIDLSTSGFTSSAGVTLTTAPDNNGGTQDQVTLLASLDFTGGTPISPGVLNTRITGLATPYNLHLTGLPTGNYTLLVSPPWTSSVTDQFEFSIIDAPSSTGSIDINTDESGTIQAITPPATQDLYAGITYPLTVTFTPDNDATGNGLSKFTVHCRSNCTNGDGSSTLPTVNFASGTSVLQTITWENLAGNGATVAGISIGTMNVTVLNELTVSYSAGFTHIGGFDDDVDHNLDSDIISSVGSGNLESTLGSSLHWSITSASPGTTVDFTTDPNNFTSSPIFSNLVTENITVKLQSHDPTVNGSNIFTQAGIDIAIIPTPSAHVSIDINSERLPTSSANVPVINVEDLGTGTATIPGSGSNLALNISVGTATHQPSGTRYIFELQRNDNSTVVLRSSNTAFASTMQFNIDLTDNAFDSNQDSNDLYKVVVKGVKRHIAGQTPDTVCDTTDNCFEIGSFFIKIKKVNYLSIY